MAGKLFRRVLLPALLLLAVATGLGSYFETNDDAAIMQLLRGTTAAAPVSTLYLYFHGLGAALAWLYQAMPAVPWYALLLYALLYAATAGAFTFLDRLLVGKLPAGWAALLLTLFFLVAWLEHGFWFNYVRVPILLAGVGVLCAAQRPQSRWALCWGLLAFALSWLIRPSAALLGLLAAAPGAWWLAGRRALPVLGGAVAWAITGAVWLQLTWSPAAATFRRLDVLKSNLLDFQLAAPPATSLSATDSLGLAAAQQWLLADSTLVNEGFFARAAPLPGPRYFLTHIAPAKLSQALPQLVRDYFPLLLLLLASVLLQAGRGVPQKKSFWLLQAGYVGLLLALAAVLKLPPRIALPLLDLWVLSNLAFVLARPAAARQAPWSILVVLAVAFVPYAYKTWHRRTTLVQERQRNQAERQRLFALVHQPPASLPELILSDAFEATYKAESPFAEHSLVARRLTVAGWTTLHPSQAAWRQQLTGTRNFAEGLRRLAQRTDVGWILTLGSARIFNYQLAQLPGRHVQLVPAAGQMDSSKNVKAYLPYLGSANYR
ncbi:hypothetical protein KBK19_18255 [Microvirga sp. STR05]|uniref:Glycosyltransferase RgtA/B/C/D-like domain-containing protein n=1 Tax=Hymenobacter duratus TaxID=2771356 RepID=A0ABR8JR03_9BACT|nr:hypothetical protein [Hymenobacter duratus]MBD2716994.1 hypothetical protein [Hymenobacter duratus]MBR7951910.1 hypothetical protein [Microvirga sp. STR05]